MSFLVLTFQMSEGCGPSATKYLSIYSSQTSHKFVIWWWLMVPNLWKYWSHCPFTISAWTSSTTWSNSINKPTGPSKALQWCKEKQNKSFGLTRPVICIGYQEKEKKYIISAWHLFFFFFCPYHMLISAVFAIWYYCIWYYLGNSKSFLLQVQM